MPNLKTEFNVNYIYFVQIVADTISFMVGGLNITGSLLTWILWYLAENPTSQDRLRIEIDSEVKGEHGEKLREYAGCSDT